MPSTLQQVAEACGVSAMTVSRILNGHGESYRQQTCERVREAAKRLKYRPNALARAMRSGRFGAVGLLLPGGRGQASLFRLRMIEGLSAHLEDHGLNFLLSYAAEEDLQRGRAPKLLQEVRADGMVVSYVGLTPPPVLVEEAEAQGLPFVWIGTSRRPNTVWLDLEQTGRQAIEFLAHLGHQRVSWVDPSGRPTPHPSGPHVDQRWRGAQERAKQLGVSLRRKPLDTSARPQTTDQVEALAKWLGRSTAPTAVIVAGYSLASLLWCAAERAGRRVPRDLSLLVAGGHPAEQFPPVTTVCEPIEALGRAAGEAIRQRIEEPQVPLEPVSIGPVFQEGVTCGPPKRT